MNEQKKAKSFRTVFGGGYQKSDVNEYIESMQAQFVSVEQTLKNTINHQRAELDDLRQRNDEMLAAQEAMDVSASELEDVRAELETVKAELEAMKVSCIAAEAGKATAEASLAAAKEEISSLTAELEAEKRASAEAISAEAAHPPQISMPETVLPADYEELKLKAEQYDRMSAHIGTIMLKANADAEDVKNRAKADADAMIDEVNLALQEKRVSAQAGADRLIADVSKSLSEISRGCREEIALDLEELRVALRTLESAVESKYTNINRKLDYSKEEMEQTAGAIIRSATTPVTLKTDA